MYDAAVNGSIEYGIVPSERQRIAVAGLTAKVDCMVHAVAFAKLLNYLEDLAIGKVEQTSNGNISPDAIKTLEQRFDEMKAEFKQVIDKGFENIEDTQHKLFYELQSGQQVIFEEFDELKDFLKSLNKKTWIQVLKSKLMLMLERQILSKATVDFIIERLNIDELGLGTKFLN